MSLVLYVTADEIRAALGVTDREISDEFIVNLGMEDQLSLKLDEVYEDHETLYNAVAGNTATSDEQKLWKILKLYLRYEGAVCLLAQLQLITFKSITDGDVDMTRFGPDNLRDLTENLLGKRDEYLTLLDPDYYTATQLTYLTAVTPALDPVTDDGL